MKNAIANPQVKKPVFRFRLKQRGDRVCPQVWTGRFRYYWRNLAGSVGCQTEEAARELCVAYAANMVRTAIITEFEI